jgi:hypothetical protein
MRQLKCHEGPLSIVIVFRRPDGPLRIWVNRVGSPLRWPLPIPPNSGHHTSGPPLPKRTNSGSRGRGLSIKSVETGWRVIPVPLLCGDHRYTSSESATDRRGSPIQKCENWVGVRAIGQLPHSLLLRVPVEPGPTRGSDWVRANRKTNLRSATSISGASRDEKSRSCACLI